MMLTEAERLRSGVHAAPMSLLGLFLTVELSTAAPMNSCVAPDSPAIGGSRGDIAEQGTYIGSRRSIFGSVTRSGATSSDLPMLNGQFDQIEAQFTAVSKAIEVLTESLVYVDNRRDQLASQFASSVESHARAAGTSTLVTASEKTIKYRGVSAAKGVKTRKDNEEKRATEGSAPAEGSTPQPPPIAGESGSPAKVREPVSRPPDNIFKIDLKPLKAFLVDLPAGAMRGMRQEQEGFGEVHAEIVDN